MANLVEPFTYRSLTRQMKALESVVESNNYWLLAQMRSGLHSFAPTGIREMVLSRDDLAQKIEYHGRTVSRYCLTATSLSEDDAIQHLQVGLSPDDDLSDLTALMRSKYENEPDRIIYENVYVRDRSDGAWIVLTDRAA